MSENVSGKESRGLSPAALLVAGAFFMEFLDGTVIATALPDMAKSFGVQAVDLFPAADDADAHDVDEEVPDRDEPDEAVGEDVFEEDLAEGMGGVLLRLPGRPLAAVDLDRRQPQLGRKALSQGRPFGPLRTARQQRGE